MNSERTEFTDFITKYGRTHRCRNKIRHILDRSNSGMSVNELIQRYNSTLRGIIYYFGITQTTRIQLRYLNNLGYRWFRRLLLQKLSSTPCLYCKMTKSYYTDDRRVKAKKASQIKTNYLMSFSNTYRDYGVLSSNIYLDLWKQ